MNNKELKSWYDERYEKNIFWGSFPNAEESLGIETIIESEEWYDKRVLEIGCGVGFLAARLANHCASVTAVDYSEKAIEKAKKFFNIPFVEFLCCDFKKINNSFDIVVSQGTWEHLNDPWGDIEFVFDRLLNKNGRFIFSTPNRINPRGYMLEVFEAAFPEKVISSDLHYLALSDVDNFCREKGFKLTVASTDHSFGHGKRCLQYMFKIAKKYIPEEKAWEMSENLVKLLPYEKPNRFNGANLVFCLQRADSDGS